MPPFNALEYFHKHLNSFSFPRSISRNFTSRHNQGVSNYALVNSAQAQYKQRNFFQKNIHKRFTS
jgi:hypothetical protein